MFLSSYVKIIYDRLEFIEFKQNILLLKQPQHKASVFAQITLDEFLKIRDYTQEIGLKIKLGEVLIISDYEKNLYEIFMLSISEHFIVNIIFFILFK